MFIYNNSLQYINNILSDIDNKNIVRDNTIYNIQNYKNNYYNIFNLINLYIQNNELYNIHINNLIVILQLIN